MQFTFQKDEVTIGADGSATVMHDGVPVELEPNRFSKKSDGSIVVSCKKELKKFRQANAHGVGRKGTARHMPSGCR